MRLRQLVPYVRSTRRKLPTRRWRRRPLLARVASARSVLTNLASFVKTLPARPARLATRHFNQYLCGPRSTAAGEFSGGMARPAHSLRQEEWAFAFRSRRVPLRGLLRFDLL